MKRVRRAMARRMHAVMAVLLMPMILPGLPQTGASLAGISKGCTECGCACCKKPVVSEGDISSASKMHGCCGSMPERSEPSTHTKCPKKCTSCLAPACNQVNYLPVMAVFSWDEPEPVYLQLASLLPPNSSAAESVFHPPRV